MKKFKFFKSRHIFKIGKLAFIMMFDNQVFKYSKEDIVHFSIENGRCGYEAIRLFWYFYWCYDEYSF